MNEEKNVFIYSSEIKHIKLFMYEVPLYTYNPLNALLRESFVNKFKCNEKVVFSQFMHKVISSKNKFRYFPLEIKI